MIARTAAKKRYCRNYRFYKEFLEGILIFFARDNLSTPPHSSTMAGIENMENIAVRVVFKSLIAGPVIFIEFVQKKGRIM